MPRILNVRTCPVGAVTLILSPLSQGEGARQLRSQHDAVRIYNQVVDAARDHVILDGNDARNIFRNHAIHGKGDIFSCKRDHALSRQHGRRLDSWLRTQVIHDLFIAPNAARFRDGLDAPYLHSAFCIQQLHRLLAGMTVLIGDENVRHVIDQSPDKILLRPLH